MPISIHAPQWGATAAWPAMTGSRAHFNPRTPVGCDRYGSGRRRPRTHFNPRTPVGCDQRLPLAGKQPIISIHAPQWGATSALSDVEARFLNFHDSVAFSSRSGSSPRVRGKPGSGHVPQHARRIIPARAGQTREWSRSAARAADHPRACGANLLSWITVSASAGSSPRVRGKLHRQLKLERRRRIIPARAGQTPLALS